MRPLWACSFVTIIVKQIMNAARHGMFRNDQLRGDAHFILIGSCDKQDTRLEETFSQKVITMIWFARVPFFESAVKLWRKIFTPARWEFFKQWMCANSRYGIFFYYLTIEYIGTSQNLNFSNLFDRWLNKFETSFYVAPILCRSRAVRTRSNTSQHNKWAAPQRVINFYINAVWHNAFCAWHNMLLCWKVLST